MKASSARPPPTERAARADELRDGRAIEPLEVERERARDAGQVVGDDEAVGRQVLASPRQEQGDRPAASRRAR